MTLRQLYLEVCDVLAEPGGLQLGYLSPTALAKIIQSVVLDFHRKTGIQAGMFSVVGPTVSGLITEPEDAMDVRYVAWDSSALAPDRPDPLGSVSNRWQERSGTPSAWTKQSEGAKKIRLTPSPRGAGTATLIATRKPAVAGITAAAFATDVARLPVPDMFSQYIKYGTLAAIFGADSETKDIFRARYCAARYQEGIALVKAITGEA